MAGDQFLPLLRILGGAGALLQIRILLWRRGELVDQRTKLHPIMMYNAAI